jgi:hypothetical protein
MEEKRRHVSLVGPAILIVFGILLLLNNLGYTSIRIWDLVRLWPVLLIAGGLDLLIGRRSRWGSVVVLVVLLVAVGAGLWFLPSLPTTAGGVDPVNEPLAGAETARVQLDVGAGVLRIGALPSADDVVRGRVELHPGERLVRNAQTVDGVREVTLRSEGNWATPIVGWQGEKVWDLALIESIPVDLRIDVGVAEVSADLRRLMVTDLYLEAGVGRATVTMPERGQVSATVDGGIGDLVIVVPHGVAVRVTASTGLGNVSVPEGYVRQGDHYVSPGYDTGAENRIDLRAEAGIGRIAVQEYEGE